MKSVISPKYSEAYLTLFKLGERGHKNSVSATTMECFLILPLNYICNTNFFSFSFLKHRDFMFFIISIFVVGITKIQSIYNTFFDHYKINIEESPA